MKEKIWSILLTMYFLGCFSLFVLVCLMISKDVFQVSLVEVNWNFPETFEEHGITFLAAPSTDEEMQEVLELMLKEGIYELSIPYPFGYFTRDRLTEYMEAYLKNYEQIGMKYIQYACSSTHRVELRVKGGFGGKEYISIYRGGAGADLEDLRAKDEVFEGGIDLMEKKLRDAGIEEQEELEQLKWIYVYVGQELEYAYDLPEYAYTGYGAIVEKEAVCQGYVAIFQAICERFGFEVLGEAGFVHEWDEAIVGPDGNGTEGAHIWSKVYVGDQWLYFDPTFGDQKGQENGELTEYNLDFFALTQGEMYLDRDCLEYTPLLPLG